MAGNSEFRLFLKDPWVKHTAHSSVCGGPVTLLCDRALQEPVWSSVLASAFLQFPNRAELRAFLTEKLLQGTLGTGTVTSVPS